MENTEHNAESERLAAQQQARLKLEGIFGLDNAFSFPTLIDLRGDQGKQNVYRAVFDTDARLPSQLGSWPFDMGTGTEATYSYGKWLAEPEDGEYLVVKLLPAVGKGAENERRTLVRTNRLFETEKSRPMKLYSYGLQERDPSQGYFLLEYVGSPFQQLEEYLPKHKSLPLKEALSLTSELATVVEKLHENRLIHGDLDGSGLLQHVFWDHKSEAIRLVDFHNSDIQFHVTESMDTDDFSIDKAGIGSLLLLGITGYSGTELKHGYKRMLEASVPSEIADDIISVVEKTVVPEAFLPSPKRYEENPSGTKQLAEDILAIKMKLENL